MLEEFRKYIRENNLFDPSQRILLAVSGGIDSMVMTHLFLRTGANIGIAHCNFNLRGSESDDDETFVKDFSSGHDIPFYCGNFDTAGFAAEKNISIQMAARELRYKWFDEIRVNKGYDLVALGHNLNDNVETFLINLTRGTGLAGLTGMKPKHKNLIRPLLFASRHTIIEYSNRQGISYREDLSNAEIKYIRNRIRHNIIPVFMDINPSFDSTISETAERLGEINEIVSGFMSGIRNKITRKRNELIVFPIDELNSLSPKRTLLFELFRPYGIGNPQLGDLMNLIGGKTGGQIFTTSHRLIRNRKEILISKQEKEADGYYIIHSPEDFNRVPGFLSAHIKQIRSDFKISSSPGIAYLDAGKIKFPLLIRRWVPGDSFYPFGMTQRKKLSDYFIDNKYSILQKENCQILESENKIVWIVGDRIDNRFRIAKSTKEVLVIEVER